MWTGAELLCYPSVDQMPFLIAFWTAIIKVVFPVRLVVHVIDLLSVYQGSLCRPSTIALPMVFIWQLMSHQMVSLPTLPTHNHSCVMQWLNPEPNQLGRFSRLARLAMHLFSRRILNPKL